MLQSYLEENPECVPWPIRASIISSLTSSLIFYFAHSAQFILDLYCLQNTSDTFLHHRLHLLFPLPKICPLQIATWFSFLPQISLHQILPHQSGHHWWFYLNSTPTITHIPTCHYNPRFFNFSDTDMLSCTILCCRMGVGVGSYALEDF